jgi:hypothetical protein
MTRNYLFMLACFCVLGAADELGNVAQEARNGTKKATTTVQISPNSFAQTATEEMLPNPDRSLGSQIIIINNSLIVADSNLGQMPPYIQQKTYHTLKSQHAEICRVFDDARNDYEILKIHDGYLFPLSEPDKKAIHKVRIMSASVSEKLQLVTTAITAFQSDFDRAMKKPERK